MVIWGESDTTMGMNYGASQIPRSHAKLLMRTEEVSSGRTGNHRENESIRKGGKGKAKEGGKGRTKTETRKRTEGSRSTGTI